MLQKTGPTSCRQAIFYPCPTWPLPCRGTVTCRRGGIQIWAFGITRSLLKRRAVVSCNFGLRTIGYALGWRGEQWIGWQEFSQEGLTTTLTTTKTWSEQTRCRKHCESQLFASDKFCKCFLGRGSSKKTQILEENTIMLIMKLHYLSVLQKRFINLLICFQHSPALSSLEAFFLRFPQVS